MKILLGWNSTAVWNNPFNFPQKLKFIFHISIPVAFRAKGKWYKHLKIENLILNPQLQTYQILTNGNQMLILCLSYFITTVNKRNFLNTIDL